MFHPITTQDQYNDVMGRIRKVDKEKAQARLDRETGVLKQQVLKAQQLVLNQEQLLDAIRVIVREEITEAMEGRK